MKPILINLVSNRNSSLISQIGLDILRRRWLCTCSVLRHPLLRRDDPAVSNRVTSNGIHCLGVPNLNQCGAKQCTMTESLERNHAPERPRSCCSSSCPVATNKRLDCLISNSQWFGLSVVTHRIAPRCTDLCGMGLDVYSSSRNGMGYDGAMGVDPTCGSGPVDLSAAQRR